MTQQHNTLRYLYEARVSQPAFLSQTFWSRTPSNADTANIGDTTSTVKSTDTGRGWLVLPPELRNRIYEFALIRPRLIHVPRWEKVSRTRPDLSHHPTNSAA